MEDMINKLSVLTIATLATLVCKSALAEIGSQSISTDLSQCGPVIGHEMGMWEFFSVIPSPKQVDRVLRTDLKFVKVSLQKLKDESWVVSHNPSQIVLDGARKPHRIEFSKTTWEEIQKLRGEPHSKVPIFRLTEYIARDQGRLCWMLSPKQPINKSLIAELTEAKILQRTVLLTSHISEVQWLQSFSADQVPSYTGRVNSSAALNTLVGLHAPLWAIEIDKNDETPAVIQAVHDANYKAYVDSMRYSKTYEFFGTACKKVFALGADYTQTNRPLQCMRKMGVY